jgi:oxygen-dependent protoporphyrinogen oxidase
MQSGWSVTVFESASSPGGRVHTDRRDGFLIDTGACALSDSYRAYLSLAAELNLSDDIVACAPCVGIFRDSHIELVRMDRIVSSLLRTRLVSWRSKGRLVRLAWDVFLAKARGQLDYSDMGRAAPLDNESARDYSLRALSAEIDDYLGSPIVRSMLIADTHKISKIELFSGVANIFGSRIYALKGGQGRLTDVLAERVRPQFESAVTSVYASAGKVTVGFTRANSRSEHLEFNACVVSCPLKVAAAICPQEHSLLGPLNAVLSYTQSITVSVATKVVPQCPAFLVQMPGCEDPDIALVFLNHNMSMDRAPPGCGLLDCHWETGAAERMMAKTDAEISARSLETVYRLFPELKGRVLFTQVARWPAALPMTRVGSYQAIAAFGAQMDPASPVQFAADYMSAAGQNSAVELGSRAAARLTRLLIERTTKQVYG